MTIEQRYLQQIIRLQFEAERYVERAKHQTVKRFRDTLLDLADEMLARVDELCARANQLATPKEF